MPLYIGKSVNIRTRVMSHFRAKDEARMLRQTTHISFVETAGELGALLTEARMIKEQQPLFNKRLRRSKQLCSLHIQEGKVAVAYAKEIDFSSTPGLFGLFANRTVALEKLRQLADEQKLCYGILGIEPGHAVARNHWTRINSVWKRRWRRCGCTAGTGRDALPLLRKGRTSPSTILFRIGSISAPWIRCKMRRVCKKSPLTLTATATRSSASRCWMAVSRPFSCSRTRLWKIIREPKLPEF